MTVKNRIRGAMIGGAVGDALGYPVEFIRVAEIRNRYGPEGITKPGRLFSDDTQMTLFTAEALIRSADRDLGDTTSIINDLSASYLHWFITQNGQMNSRMAVELIKQYPSALLDDDRLYALRAPGTTCMSALRATQKLGVMATNKSPGCGTVMRTAPIGLYFYRDPIMAYKVAGWASALTHGGMGAIVAGAAGAMLHAYLTQGMQKRKAVLKVIKYLQTVTLPKVEQKYPSKSVIEEEEVDDTSDASLAAYDSFLYNESSGGGWYKEWDGALNNNKKKKSKKKKGGGFTFGFAPLGTPVQQVEKLIKLLELAVSHKKRVYVPAALGDGFHADSALAVAVYCLLHTDSFYEAIHKAANFDGDADTTGAIAGNLAGAYYGIDGIDSALYSKIEAIDLVDDYADLLYDVMHVDEEAENAKTVIDLERVET